jgi:hypothetical protein
MTRQPFKSAPALKARPLPVMIPQVNAPSASIQFQIASSSAWPSMLIQFKSLARLSFTSTTLGRGKETMQCFVDGTFVSNLGTGAMMDVLKESSDRDCEAVKGDPKVE